MDVNVSFFAFIASALLGDTAESRILRSLDLCLEQLDVLLSSGNDKVVAQVIYVMLCGCVLVIACLCNITISIPLLYNLIDGVIAVF